MKHGIGRHIWAIPEGYIPSKSTGPEDMVSHETICILNTNTEPAKIEMMLYFNDRPPVGPYQIYVPAARTLHLRFNDLKDPAPVPKDTDYACALVSSLPVIVQHTRLDSRQAANALLSTIAYAQDA